MENKDCFGYKEKNGHSGCRSLKKLYCKREECKFYKNDITEEEIEEDIKKYAIAYKK